MAGVSAGGGAVASGVIAVLESPEGGMAPALDDLARTLDEHAVRFRTEHGLPPDEREPFVGLRYDERLALVGELLAPEHPERAMWAGLAMFSFMAFDTGAHMHTADAIAAGHPGLAVLGFAPPGEDGLWRFPAYSYGRQLADVHPDTDPTGSPA
ncbi:regulator [Streptomyces pluripotens]|uniref:Regulator n=1 Tax=Streptomyces pluripotens TaxID=1355015 RepID=A0A221P7D0_9ACTN|nr:regulator [Streptomyces pluripotens]ASN28169.1 regulator [Streptomyces pluripotens]